MGISNTLYMQNYRLNQPRLKEYAEKLDCKLGLILTAGSWQRLHYVTIAKARGVRLHLDDGTTTFFDVSQVRYDPATCKAREKAEREKAEREREGKCESEGAA